jgi:lipoyl(octanoyl) transferase
VIELTWLPRPVPYCSVWQAMRDYTNVRKADSPDVIWLVEHEPVYTLGQAGKPEHVLNPGAIELVHCDRGGQVTYHGPGQVVLYPLLDLRRYRLFVRDYVELLEDVAIDTLSGLGIAGACRKPGAPGVYVPLAATRPGAVAAAAANARADAPGAADAGLSGAGKMAAGSPLAEPGELAKIAALGIKIRNGCAYHGLAMNVDMDLTPFLGINPCGYEGLVTTDIRSCGVHANLADIGERLAGLLRKRLLERL